MVSVDVKHHERSRKAVYKTNGAQSPGEIKKREVELGSHIRLAEHIRTHTRAHMQRERERERERERGREKKQGLGYDFIHLLLLVKTKQTKKQVCITTEQT